MKSRIDVRHIPPTFLFRVVLVLLSIEYVNLPGDLSVYKLALAPLSGLGALWMLRKRYSSWEWLGLGVLLAVDILILLTALRHRDWNLLVTGIGLIPFLVFTYLYALRYRWDRSSAIIIACYSLPHLLSLFLSHLGLSDEAFSKSALRFDGLHSDPNFLALFVLASLTGKLVLFRLTYWQRWRLVLFILICLDLYMLILSGSKGALVGLIVLLLFWLVDTIGIARSIAIVVGAWLAFSIISKPVVRSLDPSEEQPGLGQVIMRMAEFEQQAKLGVAGIPRLYFWREAERMISKEGVWLGYSLRRFVERIGNWPHNTIIDAALESGVLGMAILLTIMVFSSVTLVRVYFGRACVASHVLYLGAAVWCTLLFLSYFQTKVFWLTLSIPFAEAMSLAGRGVRSHGRDAC